MRLIHYSGLDSNIKFDDSDHHKLCLHFLSFITDLPEMQI